jgi:hypothetical protein
MKHLEHTYDLRLSDWGPYTKKYIGISHIVDREKGLRFDLSVIPGFYRRKLDVPNVMWESGYHPWEAASDFRYFSNRHELEWKDRVYVDVSFSKMEENLRLIRCTCFNRTDDPQNLVLHLMASLHGPAIASHGERLRVCRAPVLPRSAVWKDALDYTDLSYATPRPSDGLVWDGLWRSEERVHGFVGGAGIGKGFGKEKGDAVTYEFIMSEPVRDAVLLTRYRGEKGVAATFRIEGLQGAAMTFEGSGEVQLAACPVGDIAAGSHPLRLISQGGSEVLFDGFVLVSKEWASEVFFEAEELDVVPHMVQGPLQNSLILHYKSAHVHYGIAWQYEDYEIREIYSDELDCFLRHFVHDHVNPVLSGNGKGHFTDVFLRPVPIAPQSRKDVYAVVCSGSLEEVKEALLQSPMDRMVCERAVEQAAAGISGDAVHAAGERYRFSQQLMRATTLTNVVFPVYTKRSYIRHSTPGRWWDSLYTWDSGFIGLGLIELDSERAIDSLNAYVTEPGDRQAAFIHHGSPVPVQHYLFLELWNRMGSRELLRYFYPRLRQYYRFLAGHTAGSTTRTLSSNLIRTWDYFYNSGGWDDYPAQIAVHRQKLGKTVAAVSNTCHCIRSAKILRMAALELGGLEADTLEYERDIRMFTDAVQTYAWDEESGYFGYVAHDESGRPQGIFRNESGINYNMGMDGAYPLIAGICRPEQEARLMERLTAADGMWTPIGLSVVDRSASYYRKDGYWNGAVWMPHQWFVWKTMLDLGYGDFARQIAETGLALWQREVERTYNCYEHFAIESGRGAGWHQFGGLSTPVLAWYSAYYRPGRLTFGFDIWVKHQSFSADFKNCIVKLRQFAPIGRPSVMLAVMNERGSYTVRCNGEELKFKELTPGTLEITLPAKEQEMTVHVIGI